MYKKNIYDGFDLAIFILQHESDKQLKLRSN